MRIAVLGASGRMGQLLTDRIERAEDLQLTAAVSRSSTPIGPGCFGDAEVVVDFSLPDALQAALPHLGDAALVTGTTGLSPEVQQALEQRAARAPVLQAANFSLGVNLLLDLVARASAALPDFDVEIVEAHHRHKRDAPSGTALALGHEVARARGQTLEAVARAGRSGHVGERAPGEIGFHAIRSGGTVGDHSVSLASMDERIELGHHAMSRDVFADGAVRAARWIAGRPAGWYSMRAVLFEP